MKQRELEMKNPHFRNITLMGELEIKDRIK